MNEPLAGWRWNVSSVMELAHRLPSELSLVSDMNITRLAPGDRCLQFDWVDGQRKGPGLTHYEIAYKKRNSADKPILLKVTKEARNAFITGLDNGHDYEINVAGIHSDKDNEERHRTSPTRLFRPGKVPGIVVNYIHPEDYTYGFSGRSPASPSIAKLANGQLVASHDVFWGEAGQNLSKIFRSPDGGNTWEFVTDLYPCFWGKLFTHRDRLYMIACSGEYGDLMVGCSDDGGETWSAPTVIMKGGHRKTVGPHRAPMPVCSCQGRLWTSIEHGSWSTGGHATGVVSASEDADLLDPANWMATPFLSYNPEWPGTIQGGEFPHLLEGNVVVTPSGELVNLLRYHTTKGTPSYGRTILLTVDKDKPDAPLAFRKVIDFHGNLSKFTINYDPVSGKYWSLVNRVSEPLSTSQRNILTLVSSADLELWEIVSDILDYQHNGWPEDLTKVGFQYVDWIFEGEDILALSRSAINGAYNFHNANYLTFHHIHHFREIKE